MFNNNTDKIIEHINNSVDLAKQNISKLTQDILSISGYSGIKTRHLYNNICDIDNINYLEIGTYLGSTIISASYKNNIYSIGVDNWSEFGGPKDICLKNIKKYVSNEYTILEKDCFSISQEDLLNKKIDIYLYDGSHDYISHIKAITHFYKFLSDISIIIIDDFRYDGNWKSVKDGTLMGIEKSNLNIIYQVIIDSKQEENGSKDFWNGCGIFLCSKK